MGFVWVHAESFLHSVASPFHSFLTTLQKALLDNNLLQSLTFHGDDQRQHARRGQPSRGGAFVNQSGVMRSGDVFR